MYNRNSSGCVTTGFLGQAQACNNVENTYHQFGTDFETEKLSGYYLVENRKNIGICCINSTIYSVQRKFISMLTVYKLLLL